MCIVNNAPLEAFAHIFFVVREITSLILFAGLSAFSKPQQSAIPASRHPLPEHVRDAYIRSLGCRTCRLKRHVIVPNMNGVRYNEQFCSIHVRLCIQMPPTGTAISSASSAGRLPISTLRKTSPSTNCRSSLAILTRTIEKPKKDRKNCSVCTAKKSKFAKCLNLFR